MILKKDKEPLIKFVNVINGLNPDEKILPYSAEKYYPRWWKEFPFNDNDTPTIKRCPAIPDFFSQGYIVPMWMDMRVTSDFGYGERANLESIEMNNPFPSWSFHPAEQFIDSIDFNISNRKPEMILKVSSPWYVVTPKGWSTLVLPLWYEFVEDYTIVPGIVDTDVLHQMNHPIIVHSDKNTINFTKGSPFICYVPFKRTKINMEFINNDKKISEYVLGQQSKWSKYRNESKNQLGSYRRMQRERDQNER